MAKKEEKKYVRIQSSISIVVTPGLQYDNLTRKDSDIPDRMKVAAYWPKLRVLIRKGVHTYLSEIVNWNAVKELQKQKLITIGEFIDTYEGEHQDEVKELEDTLVEVKSKMSLSEIAGE